MKYYDTVVEALNDLNKRGFTIDLNIAFDKKLCAQYDKCLSPSEFEITEIYRFEGSTNPSDEDIIYAVSSKDGKIKGIFIEAFGVYSNGENPVLLLSNQT